jgi:hypothetical protein
MKGCNQTRNGKGTTGHGRGWERLARAVQKSGKHDFGMKLDLYIDKSVEIEIKLQRYQKRRQQRELHKRVLRRVIHPYTKTRE